MGLRAVALKLSPWNWARGSLLALLPLIGSNAPAAEMEQSRVDQLFGAFQAPHSPGCGLGVIRNGALIYRKNYGAASLELNVPLSDQSVFYLASVSKQFTAASVVLASEQGFVSLDDSVRKYIPELPSYAQPVTLSHLLHHTSGFRDVWGLLELSGRSLSDEHPKQKLLQLIARQQAPNFKVGDEYQYSNTNYFLLAEVVARATGKSLAEFAEENIFRPLEMTRTRFYDDHTAVIPGRVAAYSQTGNGDFVVDWSTSFDNVGAGGLMSTVDDLARWDQNFYDNRLGKGTLLRVLQAPGALNSGRRIGSALGGGETYRGLRIFEQAGSLFGYRSDMLRFPDQRFTVVCLCNTSSADPVALVRQVADIYLGAEFSALPQPKQKAAASRPNPKGRRFAGRYLDRRDHNVVAFDADEHGLLWLGRALRSVRTDRFETAGGHTFTFNDSEGAMQVTATYQGNAWFVGERVDEFHPDDTTLRSYAGVYTAPELDARFKLVAENGRLIVYRGASPAQALAPVTTDEFENPVIGKIQFHRDAEGKISGFSVFGDGIRDLVFARVGPSV